MDYGTWDINGKSVPVASTYRIAWRRMAATTGFRTLYPALIPPGAKHIHPVVSAGHPEKLDAVELTGASLSSILVDFRIRSGGASEIQASQAKLLPVVIDGDFRTVLMETYLRLNCVTDAYEPLWSALTGENWDLQTPIRTPMERQLAQIKIDVIVALAFGITVEKLRRIYRTQFPVMRRYDQESLFDKNGQQLPKEITRKLLTKQTNSVLPPEERTWEHPQSGVNYQYEYPFRTFDREYEMERLFRQFN